MLFSGAVEIIKDKSEHYWSSQFYHITMQFFHKPRLPPPFVIIEHAYLVLRTIYRWLRGGVTGKTLQQSLFLPDKEQNHR